MSKGKIVWQIMKALEACTQECPSPTTSPCTSRAQAPPSTAISLGGVVACQEQVMASPALIKVKGRRTPIVLMGCTRQVTDQQVTTRDLTTNHLLLLLLTTAPK